ncbi:Mechanosensitive ion channel-domain-containing protein [Crassisporium funariophilum]|nr:Mechanosensitive ion channel-domain-containing protein [Crassisporium funariophilum]
MVSVPLHDAEDRQRAKVQFPDALLNKANANAPPMMPYAYNRQDSDAFSSRASSIAGDEDDSDIYDWSDEEDLVDEEAKFQNKMGIKEKRQGWGFKRIVSVLFSSLIGSTLLAGILITPALLVHFYWYTPHPTPHRRYIKDNIQAWLFWAAANLVISWYLAMLIDIVPILVRYFISAAWGHVSEAVKSKMEMYDSVKDTAKPAFYAASAYASWDIIFVSIYKLHSETEGVESRALYTNRLVQAVQFFFFLILVWCAQRMLSHFIAFSFHRTAYRDRIEAVETTLIVIEKLRAYRPKLPTHTPHKSGTRTPVFGSLGFSTFSDKQHFTLLSGALRTAAATPPASRGIRTARHEDGEEGDEEDADRTLVDPWSRKANGKAKNRLSWFGGASGNPSRQDTGSTDAHEREKRRSGDEDIEMTPAVPAGVHGSNTMTPSQLNPHRYPPPSPRTGSPRASVDTPSSDAAFKTVAKAIKSAVLHDARNISGKDDVIGGLSWDVNSAHEAKRLARSIYMRFKDRGRTWLIPSDFYPAFPSTDSAEEAFKVFDKDNNHDLSRAEIKTTLLKTYKERRFLSRSMRDVGEALRTLDRILLFFAGVVLFFISLSVFGVEVGDSLSSVYTIGIAASFIFKNAASSAFDAIMFLFVTHPYDTGDRIFIDQENLVVKKVGLFATVFARSDGTETYYFNSQLFTKFITNVRRSGKTFENLTMQVAWTTPLTKLDALEKCLNDWLSTEENRWFEPSTNIVLQHIVYQRYLELTIGIGHNGYVTSCPRDTVGMVELLMPLRSQKLAGLGPAQLPQNRIPRRSPILLPPTQHPRLRSPLPIVYAHPATATYHPTPTPSPGPDDTMSPVDGDGDGPVSPRTEERQRREALETEREAKNMKATLGFLPPIAVRSEQLTRVRRSKSRKAVMGAGAGNG